MMSIAALESWKIDFSFSEIRDRTSIEGSTSSWCVFMVCRYPITEATPPSFIVTEELLAKKLLILVLTEQKQVPFLSTMPARNCSASDNTKYVSGVCGKLALGSCPILINCSRGASAPSNLTTKGNFVSSWKRIRLFSPVQRLHTQCGKVH